MFCELSNKSTRSGLQNKGGKVIYWLKLDL